MGRASQQRRAAKQQRRQTRQNHHPGTAFTRGGPERGAPQRSSHGQVLAEIIQFAFEAWNAGDPDGQEAAHAVLLAVPDHGSWRADATTALNDFLIRSVTRAWEGGWQPADLDRIVERKLGSAHLPIIRNLIAEELAQYTPATVGPGWHAQLAGAGASVWWRSDQNALLASMEQASAERKVLPGRDSWSTVMPLAMDLLCQLSVLVQLEALGPVPGKYRPAAGAPSGQPASGPAPDEKVLARIRAMLAKAEATTSEAEAEAFTAGAQERMARYSIDRAMLEASDPDRPRVPGGRRIGIDAPYEPAKAVLLDKVAMANRCRAVWYKDLGFSTVVGFETDLAAVETLFTSLLVQAVSAMTRAGAGAAGGRSRSRSFRQSFLIAYASRIGERLAEITQAQTAAADSEQRQADAEAGRRNGANVLPVLAARDRAVEDQAQEWFPHVVARSAGNITDGAGYHSGRAAADLASLEARASVPG